MPVFHTEFMLKAYTRLYNMSKGRAQMRTRLLCAAVIVLVLATVSTASPRTAYAWEWGTIFYKGDVTRIDGTPVANLMVEATDCLNSPTDFTDAKGHYYIEGSAHLCLSDPMTISTRIEYSPNLSAKDKNSLVNSTALATGPSNYIKTADIRMGVKTVQVPEYGWAGGTIAAGSAIGVIAFVRRRRGTVASPMK
jgi:hypothetical protein